MPTQKTTSNVRWFDGDPVNDGCGLGATATSKVGFFGTTPVVQLALTVVATTTSATAAANKTEIDRLYAGLISIGLITTGG